MAAAMAAMVGAATVGIDGDRQSIPSSGTRPLAGCGRKGEGLHAHDLQTPTKQGGNGWYQDAEVRIPGMAIPAITSTGGLAIVGAAVTRSN